MCAIQVSLCDVCAMLQALARQAGPKRDAASSSVRSLPGVVAAAAGVVHPLVAADVARRWRDDTDHTHFRPHHYVTLLGQADHLWPRDATVPVGLTDVAADEIEGAPHVWPTRHIVRVVTRCAELELPAHRLFATAGRELSARIDATYNTARISDAGLCAPMLSLDEAENVLWAFAVTRRAYPFSAAQVSRAVASFLQRTLEEGGTRVSTEVLVDMLWSFAAMWHTPVRLFELARTVLDDPERSTDARSNAVLSESLRWSFHRAGMAPPVAYQATALDS